MKTGNGKMRSRRLASSSKRGVRAQFGALCYRVLNGKVRVLLITSRGTGRWIVPKGWPMPGATPVEAVMQEVWEEAGVEGRPRSNCIGIYSYTKRDADRKWPCMVAVFAVKVKALRTDYPESKQRRRKWFSRKKAAKLLAEPELKRMVLDFDPNVSPR